MPGQILRIMNPSEILWLSSFPAKIKKKPIKNEGARVATTLFFFRRSRAAYSIVRDGILSKFKLIQAFMVGLVTCKNEEDPSNNGGTRVVTTFFHYKSMGIFPDAQGQLTHKSLVRSSEFRTHPRYYGCPRFLQKLRRTNQK